MKAYPQNSTAKRIFAGLLAVWMSGVVFLFCCGAPKAQAAEMESCPLAKKSHCHKLTADKSSKDENAVQFEAFQNETSALGCCGFIPTLFDKIRRVEKNRQIAEIPRKPETKSLPLVFIPVKTKVFVSYRSRTSNRGGTYLKNQVFRI